MFSIDVDTGGTMTDTLVSGAGKPLLIKVESTPHDVTVSFMQSLKAAAAALGFAALAELLEQVKVIKWSSTITSNVLAERKGPKLGLIVSDGHQGDLYSSDPGDAARIVPSLVQPGHIVGLPDGADRGDIVALLKSLIDQGIRRVNICLRGAFPDGRREQEILRIVAEEFPDHYLGSIPALAGSDMLMRPDDMSRTFFSLINAYVHNSLAASLFRAEDQVKVDHNWKGDILVGHLNGGVARIGKTKAVDTIESGPLFGAHASAYVAERLGLPRVLALDIGGTTAKASMVSAGRIEMRPQGDIFGIPLRMPMPVLRSIALGGGSVARAEEGAVALGPKSMGAAPGPACYGLGGTRATLTDALVVLGLLSPTAFLEGRRVLDVDKAKAAIASDVADPLQLSVSDAAQRILDQAVDMMAQLARHVLADPEEGTGEPVVMFAYGGNGPLFATSLAERLGVAEVRLFGLGTIFSAYGSAIADVLHVYERALVSDRVTVDELCSAGAGLEDQARRDLKGEGFDPEAAEYRWFVEDEGGVGAGMPGDLAKVAGELLSGHQRPQLLRLEARFPMEKLEIPEGDAGGDATSATRVCPLIPDGELNVHPHAGALDRSFTGPVAFDGGTFTWYIGPGWRIDIDRRGDAVVRRPGADHG